VLLGYAGVTPGGGVVGSNGVYFGERGVGLRERGVKAHGF
jgi:hypothetical protein